MKYNFENIVKDILFKIRKYRSEGKEIFATSSFQTTSVVLLHILDKSGANIPIYFLNTGYHFPETIAYKNTLAKLFHLKIIDLFSDIPKSNQLNAYGQLMYTSDPDRCCYFNKVRSLENIITKYDVWITGVRKVQTSERKKMREKGQGKDGIIICRPILDWTDEMMKEYVEFYNLPMHPLSTWSSNMSIGCEPCTKIVKCDELWPARAGRWVGLKKTECGIHTELGRKA